MCDVNGEACFSPNMFETSLNMILQIQACVIKKVHEVETHWFSAQEKVPGTAISKNEILTVFWVIKRHILEKSTSVKSFLWPAPLKKKFTLFLENPRVYIYHHRVVPLARISLTLSRHFSLSFIASARSSGLHPVSSHSCWMYVLAGRPALARLYVGVRRSTSLMSLSLLLRQCPACLVRLTWIVFVMGGRWPYSWCLVGCCRQDFFNIARNILV